LVDDVTQVGTKITSNIYGQVVATSETAVTGLNIAMGKFVKISFCTSTSGGSTQNVNISGFDITPLSSEPTITAFTAAGVSATINQAAKTITAELPYGTDLAAITPTVTIGGTATSYSPTGAQNFSGGAVTYSAIDGSTTVNYAVTLTVPASPPAPIITLSTANATQMPKAGTAIANIVYNLTNAVGASVTGLPAGLSGNFVSTGTNIGTYTISGNVDAGVTPSAFNYTVTATKISGYSGADVSSDGSIIVKSTTAKQILYLTASSSVSTTDTKLYPLLNNNPNYVVTIKQAASTAPLATEYATFDLIVLNEIVSGGNVEANALIAINKPILNLKSFQYNTGRWGWGTADNGAANNGIVTVVQPTHPIFSGITLSGETLSLLTAPATKGIQPVDVTLVGGIAVASAAKSTTGTGVAIHDIPASVRSVADAKYLMVAIANDSYDKMNADALLLLDNAVSYLISGAQFVPATTLIKTNNETSLSFDGKTLRNPNRELVRIYDATGRFIVTSSTDIEMTQFTKGIYVVKSTNGILKVAVK
jgi:hypothetical protein